MIKTAVIMAAGLGTRFGVKTELMPKGFIEVGGKSMITRAIDTLISCGIKRIIIGTGYMKEMYESLFGLYPQIECIYNEKYEITNSMWTLHNCQRLIGNDDFILLESDLIFEKKAIFGLLNNQATDIMLCSDVIKFQDSYFIEYNNDEQLVNCSVNRIDLNVCGELVGIHKISNNFYKKLCEYYDTILETKPKLGYEYGLLHMAQTKIPMSVLKIKDLKWYEIDDDQDLEFAEKNITAHLN